MHEGRSGWSGPRALDYLPGARLLDVGRGGGVFGSGEVAGDGVFGTDGVDYDLEKEGVLAGVELQGLVEVAVLLFVELVVREDIEGEAALFVVGLFEFEADGADGFTLALGDGELVDVAVSAVLEDFQLVVIAGDEGGVVADVALDGLELGDGGGEVALGFCDIGFDAADIGFDGGDFGGDGGDLLVGGGLSGFETLAVGFFAAEDVLGACFELLLGESEFFAELFVGDFEAGVGFAEVGGQLGVLLVCLSEGGFRVGEPAGQGVGPNQACQRQDQRYGDYSKKSSRN